MSRNEIFEKLNEVFRDVFDDNTITVNENTTAAEYFRLGFAYAITLIGEVESTFGIRFMMKEVVTMKNVGEMADIIEARSDR